MTTLATTEWDWARLDIGERERRWDALVAWTGWLQEHYAAWVTLPPCWPRHEALRAELEFFRSWHAQLLDDGDGSEGVSWHASLRAAATAWKDLADCEHDAQFVRRTERGGGGEFQRHLAEATRSRPSVRPKRGT